MAHPVRGLRRYLVAGLLIWIPLGITYFVFNLAVGLMDRSLLLLPPAFRPENLLGFNIPGLGIILTLLVLLVTGIAAANILGRSLFNFGESLLNRIPLVRSVYSGAKNFAEVVLGDTNQSFKKVLLIEYPRKGIYSLCFQTSTDVGEIQARTGSEVVCCFVPTTPNPTSGFIIMVPRQDVIVLDMEVEQALKMIVSLGVVVPRWRKGEEPAQLAKVAEPT